MAHAAAKALLIFLGSAGLFTLVFFGFWYGCRKAPPVAKCKGCLRNIGLGCQLYADENDERFPPDFKTLIPKYIDNPAVLSCPDAPSSWQDFEAGGTVTEASSSYALESGLGMDMPGGFILSYDKSLENHKGRGRNVVFVDGHVEWRHASREDEFPKQLAAQRRAVEEWRASGKPIEALEEIYRRIFEEVMK